MKKSIKSSLLHALAAAILVGMPMQQAQSAPGTLPTSPLYLSTIVEPNVFLTFDDSRSMVTASLVPQDKTKVDGGSSITITGESLPLVEISGVYTLMVYLNPDAFPFNVVPPVAVSPAAWILKNSDANKLYYNPKVNYKPWPGRDAAGNPLYKEFGTLTKVLGQSALIVPMDPNDQTVVTSGTDLLAAHRYYEFGPVGGTDIYLNTYYIWDDTNSNGVVDADTDAHTEVRVTTSSAELQNFSNWFVYYRTRESSMKAAMGRIISNTDSNRMGLSLFNAGHQIDAATMTDSTNKLAMLKTFYSTNAVLPSNLLSPARTALDEVGMMFEGRSTVASPIVPAVDGGTCQQNFNIMMTDGYWNGPDPGGWGTNAPGDSLNADEDGAGDFDGGSYADTFSNTLADVAMHYYETDLDTALLDEVPDRAGIDQANHQHLVNYTLSFGIEGTVPTAQDPAVTGLAWPEPVAGTATTVDDLWHASYNSRGKHLSVGGSSTELEAELSRSFADISERTGTAAAVAVNSARLSTNSAIYLAQFNTNRWQGNLRSIKIDTKTGALLTENWNASETLTPRDMVGKPRQIITYDKDLAAAQKGVPFRWANLSAGMKNDLLTNPLGALDTDSSSAGPGAARLDYIRGDRSNETFGLGFRERLSLLGDLVNSGPVFVGAPDLAWPDGGLFPPAGTEAYSTFKKTYESRKSMVYVGANDGMLHVFDDSNGEEVFAYIPGMLYADGVANEGLHYLSDPDYIHKYYVDLTPSISDIYINTNWHTVLIGGLRGGGRGIFALDVTNPGSFSEINAAKLSLWEFTSADDADLGYTFSRPVIGLTNAGTWVAIFGNGYNQIGTGSGEAALFIVDIAKGMDGSWDAGDWIKISTGVGTPGAQNGLAPPALADLDGNGTIDRAYAGDLEGNMWVFDLSSTSEANWNIAYKSGSTPVPLFTTPTKQQLTAKPVLASHPTQPDQNNNEPNIMVFFGTGQYLVSGDKVTADMQSFYGVWDRGSSGLTQLDLIQQTFDASFSGRVLTRNAVDYPNVDGWYFNLTDSGERAVTSPIARADTVFFNTFVPSNAPCDLGGYGYRFAVDMATGGSPLLATIDSNGDGVIDDNDYQSNGIDQSTLAAVRQEGFLPEPVFIEDLAFTGEQASKIKSLATVPSGRFSWQELLF